LKGLTFTDEDKKEIISGIEKTEVMVLEKKRQLPLGEKSSLRDKYVLLSYKTEIKTFYDEKKEQF
jgi:hypothetical protein